MTISQDKPLAATQGDAVLREMWRIKDKRSAERGHDVHRLFADARERYGISGQSAIDPQHKATSGQ